MLLFLLISAPPAILSAIAYFVLVWRLSVRDRRLRDHCPSCDYDLAGIDAGSPCPECGRLADRAACTPEETQPIGRSFREHPGAVIMLLAAPLALPIVILLGAKAVHRATSFDLYRELPGELTGMVAFSVLFGMGTLLHCVLIELITRRLGSSRRTVRAAMLRAFLLFLMSGTVCWFATLWTILPFWLD